MSDDIVDLRRIAYETWRFQVDSYWTRNSYFAVFEIAAVTGVWTLGEKGHHGTALCFGLLCAALTIVWLQSNTRVHEYIEFWWEMAIDSDSFDTSSQSGPAKRFALASRFKQWRETKRKGKHHWCRYSSLIQIIPALFLVGRFYLGVKDVRNLHAPVVVSADQTGRTVSANAASPALTVSIPEVSVKSEKDVYDKTLVFATVLLVVVGGFQIFYLWRTVGATRDSATAALRNAQAVIDSERAWMLPAVMVEPRNLMEMTPDNSSHTIEISIRFTNAGRTPALVTGWCCNTLITPTERTIPFEYAGINASLNNGEAMPAGESDNLFANFLVPQRSTVAEIREGRRYLYVYGFLTYRDIFDRSHETYFSRRYDRRQVAPGTFDEGWMVLGPEGANHYT